MCHIVSPKQCSHKQYVELPDLEKKWKNLCLPVEKFRNLLELDPCEDKIEWIKFLALGCSSLGGVRTLNSIQYYNNYLIICVINYIPGLKIIWVKKYLGLSNYRKHFDYFINVLGEKTSNFSGNNVFPDLVM